MCFTPYTRNPTNPVMGPMCSGLGAKWGHYYGFDAVFPTYDVYFIRNVWVSVVQTPIFTLTLTYYMCCILYICIWLLGCGVFVGLSLGYMCI